MKLRLGALLLLLALALTVNSTFAHAGDAPPSAWQRLTARTKSWFVRTPAAPSTSAPAANRGVSRASWNEPIARQPASPSVSVQKRDAKDMPPKTSPTSGRPPRTVSQFMSEERP
jgi:hypothetical protein